MRKNIKLRVKNLVNKYQTADPFALAKELDVNILYVPLPEKIRGILVRVLRKKTILLNDKLNYEAQKIVICHELGHVRMHWHAGYFFQHEGIYYSPARYECEANEFAIHLLNYSSDFIYDKDYILEVLAKENPNPYEVHKIINALMQIESILFIICLLNRFS